MINIDNDSPYFCNDKRCEMRLIPFHSSSFPTYPNFPISLPNESCIINSESSKPVIFTSSERINLLKTKAAKSSKSVYFDPFLDIKCAYKCPTEIDDTFLETSSSLSIFHNNIRSLNKNFDKLEEVFQNCSTLPSILALSETKLSSTSNIPPLNGIIIPLRGSLILHCDSMILLKYSLNSVSLDHAMYRPWLLLLLHR